MTWVVAAYSVVYAVLWGCGIWTDVVSRYSRWVVALDLLAGGAGLAGMILYCLSLSDPTVKHVWKAVFVVVVVGTIVVCAIDAFDQLAENVQNSKDTVVATAVALLFELPCFIVNYLFAFSA